jgi:hypothetical protein
MRAKPSLRLQEERPIKTTTVFSNRLEERLRIRYTELMRLRQAVLEAESTSSTRHGQPSEKLCIRETECRRLRQV